VYLANDHFSLTQQSPIGSTENIHSVLDGGLELVEPRSQDGGALLRVHVLVDLRHRVEHLLDLGVLAGVRRVPQDVAKQQLVAR
jgi:hypothetical protein